MSRPRILVFASLLPIPVDRGDKNRLFNVLKLLSRFAEVRLVCLSRDWEPAVTDLSLLDGIETRVLPVGRQEAIWQGLKALASWRPFIAFRFSPPRIVGAVLREAADFRADVFWAGGIPAYPLLQRMTGVRRVLDLGDSPSLYNAMARRSSKMPLWARAQSSVQWRLQFYESLALRASHHVLVSSRRDREHLFRLNGQRLNIHVLENCVSRDFMARQWQALPGRSPKLLFVGNLAYPPNRAGVVLAARHILPRVRSRFSEAELIVCGQGGDRQVRKLAHEPGVRVVGYIEDLVSMYLEASVFVSPVPVVGGPQYKILEAMALGLPVVTTGQSAELSEVTPGRELLTGESAEEMASAVLSILANSDLAAAVSAKARTFIREHRTWESKEDVVRSIVLGPEPPAKAATAFQ
jgi:glycosyltransferase involved in cell wall biosynthesis